MGRRKPRRRVKTVTSTSTKIPPGLFGRDAATISRTLTLPGVSPKGPVSGLRMRSFSIDRAGDQLTGGPAGRAREGQTAMQQRIAADRGQS